jgi:hypothetical protein
MSKVEYSISNIILTQYIYAEIVNVHDTYYLVTPAHDIGVMNGYKAIFTVKIHPQSPSPSGGRVGVNRSIFISGGGIAPMP